MSALNPTPRQKEIADAYKAFGTISAAAKHVGVARQTIRQALRAGGIIPMPDSALTSGDDFIPEGHRLRGLSTLVSRDPDTGDPVATSQWVKTTAGELKRDEVVAAAKEVFSGHIQPVKPCKVPLINHDDTLVVYPVMDSHIGMLAWEPETGEDYDTAIAEDLLLSAVTSLAKRSPRGSHGLLLLGGDLFHTNGNDPHTPGGRNLLDVDSRFPKVARAVFRVVDNSIKTLASRHTTLRVVVLAGNHDPDLSIMMQESLRMRWADDPHVTIDDGAATIRYHCFGRNLIGMHHGDKTPMNQLAAVMACDQAPLWGETDHRFILTGHIHRDSVIDAHGCRVESFRTLAAKDAWSTGKGYRSGRQLSCIILDRTHGETARNSVTPRMLAQQKG